TPAKPVDGPDGAALLDAAVEEHQANADAHDLMAAAPFRDSSVPGLDWAAASPSTSTSSDVPMLVRAGWLDGGFAAGALTRFATRTNPQEVEIGPWSHGGGGLADTMRPNGLADGHLLDPDGQDRRLVRFFARHLDEGGDPAGTRTLRVVSLGSRDWHTVASWPPEGLTVRRAYLGGAGTLTTAP